MLSRLSIRAKIISIISFLLLAMAGMGALSMLEMESIHANALDIGTNWLPSVRELGELRANTITYGIAVHAHLLAADAAGKDAAEKTLDTVGQAVDKTRKAYEPMITSPDEQRSTTRFPSNGRPMSQASGICLRYRGRATPSPASMSTTPRLIRSG